VAPDPGDKFSTLERLPGLVASVNVAYTSSELRPSPPLQLRSILKGRSADVEPIPLKTVLETTPSEVWMVSFDEKEQVGGLLTRTVVVPAYRNRA
jgi:hypothetical protein